MALKVKDVQAALSGCDPEAKVYMYIGEAEEQGGVRKVVETTDRFPYCKADPPTTIKKGEKYVLLSGYPE